MLKEGAHAVARLGAFKCIHCDRPLGRDRYDRGASRRRSRRNHCGQCWGNPRIRRGHPESSWTLCGRHSTRQQASAAVSGPAGVWPKRLCIAFAGVSSPIRGQMKTRRTRQPEPRLGFLVGAIADPAPPSREKKSGPKEKTRGQVGRGAELGRSRRPPPPCGGPVRRTCSPEGRRRRP